MFKLNPRDAQAHGRENRPTRARTALVTNVPFAPAQSISGVRERQERVASDMLRLIHLKERERI